ncbi:MAG TPA: DUF1552 domain-containing protein [Nannocystaceae bacterium]|nr:DUF1552 domain-containing protein [Nannocystaceae bacterium]
MARRFLSRRTMLRGALGGGATAMVGLPILDAMLTSSGARADGLEDGPIAGVFFWANGLPWHAGHGAVQAGPPDDWTPAATGPGFAASPLLGLLGAHPFSVATGLTPVTEIPATPDGQGDGHMRGFMVALTSDRPRPEGFNHASHTLTALRPSIDQYIAKHDEFYGSLVPRFRSLEIGISDARFHDYGHWNAISYNGPDSLNLPVSDPGQLYDLLFSIPADVDSVARRARLLDAVKEDAADLSKTLGAGDKIRVDEHLSHLDEIQRRLELTSTPCTGPSPPAGSSDLHQKTAIMADLLAFGLGCGLTRVFSFMLTSPATTHVFSNLGVGNDMHTVCHAGTWQSIYDISVYHMQALNLLLDRFAAQVDPTGTNLLDRLCMYATSEYGEGWQHGNAEHPVLLVGKSCGALVPNVHVREVGGNLSKAHVTMLRAVGIETPSYGFNGGETTEHLAGILA